MDKELRFQILRAAVRDRTFLKSSWRDLQPTDFPDKEERIVAEAALQFYEKYEQPISGLLRSSVDDIASREKLGSDSRKKLKSLLDTIQGYTMELVSVKALEDRVKSLKHNSFYERALDEVVLAQETGKLTVETFAGIVEKASKELHHNGFVARDYFSDAELKKRIEQRKLFSDGKRYPLFLIEPLDEKIKAIGRGHLGMIMGSYNSGKGLMLLWLVTSYAMQGLNVLHISLEDAKDIVEARLDAQLTGIPVNRLHLVPNRLKKRFKVAKQEIRGRIRLIDGTSEPWSVTRVERAWDELRQEGFTADVIIVDYDDEIECERQFKGESTRRFEFAEIYKRLRRLAVKTDTIVWTASQTGKAAEGKKIVTGKEAAEDISKVRKVYLSIGIGVDPQVENLKYLYVQRHRLDRSRFGVEVMSSFDSALFYDRDATLAYRRIKR